MEELRQSCEAAIASKARGDALEFHSFVQRITSCSDYVRLHSLREHIVVYLHASHSCLVYVDLQGMLRQWLSALTHCASDITVRD